jgi:hypothetical protein
MRGRVMHVGGEPDRIGDAILLDEAQEIGDLQLAAQGRAALLVGDGLEIVAVRDEALLLRIFRSPESARWGRACARTLGGIRGGCMTRPFQWH